MTLWVTPTDWQRESGVAGAAATAASRPSVTTVRNWDNREVLDQSDEGVITSEAGRRIGYLARGPKSGRQVVYLHGMPGSRREQRVFPDAVLERFDVRLISFDRPGYGESDPAGGDRIARISDVFAACDALGITSFPLIAVSAGGSYALTLAALSASRVKRLVLTSAQMPYEDEAAIRGLQPTKLSLLPALRKGRSDRVVCGLEEMRAHLLADPIGALASEAATLTDRERTWFVQPWVRDVFIQDVREGVRARVDGLLDDCLAWPHPFEAEIDAIRCPVRAVHGTGDDWEPLTNLQRVLRVLPDTQLFLLDSLNHFGPLMYPDLIIGLAVSTE